MNALYIEADQRLEKSAQLPLSRITIIIHGYRHLTPCTLTPEFTIASQPHTLSLCLLHWPDQEGHLQSSRLLTLNVWAEHHTVTCQQQSTAGHDTYPILYKNTGLLGSSSNSKLRMSTNRIDLIMARANR